MKGRREMSNCSDPQPPNLGGEEAKERREMGNCSDPQPPNLGGAETERKGLFDAVEIFLWYNGHGSLAGTNVSTDVNGQLMRLFNRLSCKYS